jgi:hypothetical protein
MVRTFRWWVHCADLRAGMRVCFEWADSDSLARTLQRLAENLMRETNSAMSAVGPRAGLMKLDSWTDVWRVLSDRLPSLPYLRMAIANLEPQHQAWFATAPVWTTWSIVHTPIWKHSPIALADAAPAESTEATTTA